MGKKETPIKKPFHNWKTATGEFRAHFMPTRWDKTKACHGNKLYNSAMTRAIEFMGYMRGEKLCNKQVLEENHKATS